MRGREPVHKVHGGDETRLGCAAANVRDVGIERWLGVWGRRRGQRADDAAMQRDFRREVRQVQEAGRAERRGAGTAWRGGIHA